VEDDGTFRIVGLPPGFHRLGHWRGDTRGNLDLQLEAGREGVEVVVPEDVLRMGKTPEEGCASTEPPPA